jgi:hypothetical protein
MPVVLLLRNPRLDGAILDHVKISRQFSGRLRHVDPERARLCRLTKRGLGQSGAPPRRSRFQAGGMSGRGRHRTTDTRIFGPTDRRRSPQNYSGNRSRSVIERGRRRWRVCQAAAAVISYVPVTRFTRTSLATGSGRTSRPSRTNRTRLWRASNCREREMFG